MATPNTVQLVIGDKPQKKKRGKPFPKGNKLGNQIKKGEVRNPHGCLGKSRGTRLLSQVYTIGLEELAPPDVCQSVGMESATWAEVAGRVLIRNAAKGDVTSIKELREVTEGKIPDKVYMTGDEGKPLTAPVLQVQFVDSPKKDDTQTNGQES